MFIRQRNKGVIADENSIFISGVPSLTIVLTVVILH